jgi:hypothetical protein
MAPSLNCTAKQRTAIPEIRGYSSAGRALAWHARGQRFDPAYLHQVIENIEFFIKNNISII